MNISKPKGPLKKEEAEPIMEAHREEYKNWKLICKDEKRGFFIIYNDFMKKEILKNISGNALKLYIYIGINSKNETGESWHSSEKIAEYFNCDKRSVKRWYAELERNNLIVRVQNGYKRVANTFLKPY